VTEIKTLQGSDMLLGESWDE
jgi:SAM-dependent methyltransferase